MYLWFVLFRFNWWLLYLAVVGLCFVLSLGLGIWWVINSGLNCR